MTETDRKTQHTRELLQKALIELVSELSYDAITIQDITDRAHVGRTTFYLHYNGKDELFMSCHEAFIGKFRSEWLHPHPLSREELLASETPQAMISAYRHLDEARPRLYSIFYGKNGPLILRQIRDRSAQEIEANLRGVFSEADSEIPLDLLANYLAGAQIALMQWWLEKHRSIKPETLALTLHRMRHAAIREAFGLREGSGIQQ